MGKKRTCLAAIVVLAFSIASFGQSWEHRGPFQLSGLISDRSAANVKPAGPWDIHGVWTLTLKEHGTKAEFSAALSMEESDYWVIANAASPDDPQLRNPHTHHIKAEGAVTALPNGGFRVTGPVVVTANGVTPPPFGPNSTIQIDVTGGGTVPFSNIAVTLMGDAAAHFGQQPLDGVVRAVK